ncbi:MAG: NAD(P)H-dependent oxidoreductase [Acidimicrobiales bacterium]|nr:NAD(P)H-dependent oxidoreductase [Acidimicrobiales bacterium]
MARPIVRPEADILLAVNGSPSSSSKTRAVVDLGIELAGGRVLDLASVDADALLFRGNHPSLDQALAAVEAADRVLLATPVYRATYSGLLKLLLDHLPQGGLSGKAVILVATGISPAHFLSVDTGLRVVVASLSGWSVPTAVYAVPSDFDEQNRPGDRLRESLTAAVAESTLVAGR